MSTVHSWHTSGNAGSQFELDPGSYDLLSNRNDQDLTITARDDGAPIRIGPGAFVLTARTIVVMSFGEAPKTISIETRE